MDALRLKTSQEVQLIEEFERLKSEVKAERIRCDSLNDELNAALQESTYAQVDLDKQMCEFEHFEDEHTALTRQVGPLRREYMLKMEEAKQLERRQLEADENVKMWKTTALTYQAVDGDGEKPAELQCELDAMRGEHDHLRSTLRESHSKESTALADARLELEKLKLELVVIDDELRAQRTRNVDLEKLVSQRQAAYSPRRSGSQSPRNSPHSSPRISPLSPRSRLQSRPQSPESPRIGKSPFSRLLHQHSPRISAESPRSRKYSPPRHSVDSPTNRMYSPTRRSESPLARARSPLLKTNPDSPRARKHSPPLRISPHSPRARNHSPLRTSPYSPLSNPHNCEKWKPWASAPHTQTRGSKPSPLSRTFASPMPAYASGSPHLSQSSRCEDRATFARLCGRGNSPSSSNSPEARPKACNPWTTAFAGQRSPETQSSTLDERDHNHAHSTAPLCSPTERATFARFYGEPKGERCVNSSSEKRAPMPMPRPYAERVRARERLAQLSRSAGAV